MSARRGNPSPSLGCCSLVPEIMLLAGIMVPLMLLDALAGVDTWLAHGHWMPPAPNALLGGWQLVTHAGDLALAWPAATRRVAPAGAVYWLTVAVAAAVILGVAGWVIRLVRRHRGGAAKHRGLASRSHLRNQLGGRAALARARTLRPSVARPSVTDVGISLGRSVEYGSALFGTVEDSYALLGPPGMFKTSTLVVPGVIDYPGPAIVTSTKPELLLLTASIRPGPAWVFDPTGTVQKAVTSRGSWQPVLWDPVLGCDVPRTAMRRARVAVSASGAGKGVTAGDYWRDSAVALCQGYLHAAALVGADLRTVTGWVDNPSDRRAVDILLDHPAAAPGWGERLAAQLSGGSDDRERRSVFNSLRRAFDCVADPEVMASCCPVGGSTFDPAKFVAGTGTLYLVGDPEDQVQVSGLLAVLLDAVVAAARERAATLPGGRLDPPLGLWLDEVTQIAPLPSLPMLVSDGRGIGITVVAVFQTLARAREVWGDDGAATLWQNCTAKLVFGGISDHEELERLSRLCGEYDETVVSHHRDADRRRSETRSTQRRRRLSPEEIRELPQRQALLLYRQMRPVTTRLTPWFEGAVRTRIAAARASAGGGR